MQFRAIGLFLCVALLPAVAPAQFKQDAPQGIKPGETSVTRWQAGVTVTAASGPCQGIVATFPVPVEWPEQDVKVVAEDVSPLVKMSERFTDGVKQMVATMPMIPYGEEARALVTFEITRRAIQPPADTAVYRVPESRKLPRDVRPYLAQSPGIECRNPRVVALAKELAGGKEGGWDKVRAMYDWVRSNVAQAEGPLRGAAAALKDRRGNHEDLTSLFIALCRAGDVPARTVWIPQHCYPEFYLVDDQGKGQWFPCDMVGESSFGGTTEARPILEKGDSFRNPTNPRDRMRYLPENLTGAGGQPKVRFVRKVVD